MKASQQSSAAAVNSRLIRRPIQHWCWLFILPTFIAFCIGFLWPFVQGFMLSFADFNTISMAKWNGLANYVKAFTNPNSGFLYSFGYTALVAVVALVAINLLAFTVAYVLTRGIKGANLYRGVFFMPNLIGGIVLGYIWSMIFGARLMLDTSYGFWSLIIVMCWQQVGYMMIIYIAGLQSVSEDMIEAARIDGANGWHVLWNITIPTVMPSITICTFLTLTNSFKLFDQNMVLTGGQPYIFANGAQIHTTEMLALNIVNDFSRGTSRGMGQAKAVVFFVLVAAIALIQLYATRSKEMQQ